jgi:hypothetical protein
VGDVDDADFLVSEEEDVGFEDQPVYEDDRSGVEPWDDFSLDSHPNHPVDESSINYACYGSPHINRDVSDTSPQMPLLRKVSFPSYTMDRPAKGNIMVLRPSSEALHLPEGHTTLVRCRSTASIGKHVLSGGQSTFGQTVRFPPGKECS